MTSTKTTPTTTEKRRRASRAALVAGIAIAALIVGVGGALIWFFAGTAPDAVDLAATASAVSEDTSAGSEGAAAVGIEGIWTVDTGVGSFAFEDSTASYVGFRVDEVLASVGSATAVGRTPTVTGTVVIDGTVLTDATITADVTAMVSDESRREDAIQRSLGTGSNPEATFVLTEPVELGDAAARGEIVAVVAVGELTVNGVTNIVEFPIEAQPVDGLVLVTGSTDVVFADYGVITPTAPAVLSVEDHGIVEFQLWFSPGT
jgi:polyisoprenoid-binding protein YceI